MQPITADKNYLTTARRDTQKNKDGKESHDCFPSPRDFHP